MLESQGRPSYGKLCVSGWNAHEALAITYLEESCPFVWPFREMAESLTTEFVHSDMQIRTARVYKKIKPRQVP